MNGRIRWMSASCLLGRVGAVVVAMGVAVSLVGCFGGKKAQRPEPAPLPVFTPLLSAAQVWTADVGEVTFPLVVKAVGASVAVAGGKDGRVMMLDAATGQVRWQATLGERISAGVGSNGQITAVVTESNDLVVFDALGKEIWRKRIAAQVLTPPLIAGGRIFVNATDHSIQAYDASNGVGLWRQQQNVTDALVLRRDGALDAYGNVLLVGLSSSLYGVNPDTGGPLWGLPIGSPRGSNEIDRLADIVGGLARQGNVMCARAYENAITCVQAGGPVLWTKKATGDQGLAVDDSNVYVTDGSGRIFAYNLRTGDTVWANEQLQYRVLGTPLALGQRTLVIGDTEGNVHLLSRQDGTFIGRLNTHKSGVAAAPVAAGDMLVVVTRNGTVYGFKPQ